MNIEEQLFQGKLVCLGPIDHEKDAEIEARWTNDPEYLRLVSVRPAAPRSAAQVRKRYERIEKEQDEGKDQYYFTLRMRSDDRLIGYARLFWIEWSNGCGRVELGIGSPADRRQGYGSDALSLLLRYAFHELNLHRLTAAVPEYNPGAVRLFEKAGFQQEVRRRQALNRDGRRWDLLHYGLLRSEWQQPGSPK